MLIISVLVVWCIFWPAQAGATLGSWNSVILNNFAAWYICVVALSVIVCLGLAAWPTRGKMLLGQPGDEPEFSNFSWFSMMFGAGISVGMLTWAIAEPVAHFQNNPSVIQGLTTAGGETIFAKLMCGPSCIGVSGPGRAMPFVECHWLTLLIAAACR